MYQPKTGERCHCKRGVARDNCPDCEGTGMRINFKAIRLRAALHKAVNDGVAKTGAVTEIPANKESKS
jgi:hypothetical protein